MPTRWSTIPDDVREWLLQQPVFFTASAPTHGKHVNISPKGFPSRSFAVLNSNQVAYLDATGSGIETIAHVYENERLTILFLSFTRYCRILRLFGRARVIERSSPEFRPFISKMQKSGMRVEPPDPKVVKKLGGEGGDLERNDVNFEVTEGNGVLGVRAIVVLDVDECVHVCGYGVPILATNPTTGDLEENENKVVSGPKVDVEKNETRSDDPYHAGSTKFDDTWDDRNTLYQYNSNKVKKGDIRAYRIKNNLASVDGVPGLEMAMRDVGQNPTTVRIEHAFRRIFQSERQALFLGLLLGLFIAVMAHRVTVMVA